MLALALLGMAVNRLKSSDFFEGETGKAGPEGEAAGIEKPTTDEVGREFLAPPEKFLAEDDGPDWRRDAHDFLSGAGAVGFTSTTGSEVDATLVAGSSRTVGGTSGTVGGTSADS